MKQVSKKKPVVKKRTVKKAVRIHPKYGTSKLEEDFAKDFLDKLGFKYIYQFEAKDIGRFYDFCVLLKEEDGLVPGNIILIEIDGGYYHSDPRVVDENKLNPMQKHNKRVDEHKNKWALMHGIPLIRIWEKDIREKPNKVLEALKKILYVADNRAILAEKKNKRHINKIK
jgi:very-short-patch-repair endonuclease